MIIKTRKTVLSPWVTLVENFISNASGSAGFHSLAQADYVNILGITTTEHIPLVRQFRPAVNRVSLELPGGLAEVGEPPMSTAVRELLEETGFRITGSVDLLCRLDPDTGRLANTCWCYFATGLERAPTWVPEEGVEAVLVPRTEFRSMVLNNRFDHAPHAAPAALAMLKGLL